MLRSYLLLLVASVLGAVRAEPGPAASRPQALRRALHGRQIQQLSTADPATVPAGTAIVPVALASDKQSYYAVIAAGNISFRVALDTGSSDTWLVSTDCTSAACKNIPKYPLSYSSPSFVTINNNQTAFAIGYADGTAASGFVAVEEVRVQNVTSPTQALGMVTASNVTFTDQVSGILGLGFPRLSAITNTISTGTPFIASLVQKGLLSYPIFGLSLTRNDTGTLALGAIDSSVVTDPRKITLHEVVEFAPFGRERNESGYLQWAIPLSTVYVGLDPLTPRPTYVTQTQNTSIAQLDVGTPGIFGPYQDVSRIFDAIEGSRLVDDGQWVVPCDTAMTLSFKFGEANYSMQPTDYLIGPAKGNPQLCLSWPRAVPPRSDGIDWQFGQAFLRTVYSIFSYGIDTKEPPIIGLYPLRNSSIIESSESVSAFFSTASATITTTLPNSLLPTPTFSTPPYIFNTSVPVSIGAIVSSDLATSTYSPVLHHAQVNTSVLPTAMPSPTVRTFLITDAAGAVHTSTSTAPSVSVTLGVPYGQQAVSDARSHPSTRWSFYPLLVCGAVLAGWIL